MFERERPPSLLLVERRRRGAAALLARQGDGLPLAPASGGVPFTVERLDSG
jgi:hypothetical protein